MTDRSIRIRVGASLDADTTAVFRPLIDAAKKARSAIDTDMNTAAKSARAIGPATKEGASKADAALADLERHLKGLPTSLDKAGGAARKFGKEAESDFAIAKARFNELARETERGSRQMERSMERAGAARRGAFARGAGRVAGIAARGALDFTSRVAGDLLHGAGIQIDLASHVASNVDLEKRAQDLSNAGYMAGDARNGRRVDKGALIGQVRAVADSAALDPAKAMEGLQAFVGKTGDLATGRDILKDMAMLSKATGTSLEDMVGAAGDVANQLDGVDNKGEVIAQVMRSVAGQGKLGAVEIRDMATQMAKVAAAASQFEGNRAENIALMGAFAQEARQRGGASSATMAATSVQSMINTFKTPSRVAAFRENGIEVFNKYGQMKNPEEILIQALQKRGTDTEGFKHMFANVQGARAVEGFASIYRSTYADTKGTEEQRAAAATKAVREEFERLKSVAMAQGEVQESFARAMATTESKVQLFNNQVARTASELQEALLPALIELSPIVIDAARGISASAKSFSDWFLSKAEGGPGNKGNVELGLAAQNTEASLKGALGGAYGQTGNQLTGTANLLPPQLLEQGTEQQHELERALAAKRQQIADDRNALNFNAKLGLNATESDIQRVASKEGGDNKRAQEYLRHEGEANELREHLESLKRANESVTEALLSGRVKVMVINQTPVKADLSGVKPAESPIDGE